MAVVLFSSTTHANINIEKAIMIRKTEIEIHGQEVTVKYRMYGGNVVWAAPVIDGNTWVCDWLLDVKSVHEALEAHHANLLEEENTNES